MYNMEKVPTACEFITSTPGHLTGDVDDETLMIEFAKMHVEAALKAAIENVEVGMIGNFALIDDKSIINSYPLENIK